jgi:hypothetical protein
VGLSRADYSASRVPGITTSGMKGLLSGLCGSGQFIGSSVTVPVTGRTYNNLEQYQEHCLNDSEHLDNEQQLECVRESLRFEE